MLCNFDMISHSGSHCTYQVATRQDKSVSSFKRSLSKWEWNCYAFPRLMLGKLWKELHCGFVTEIGSGNMTLSNPDISTSGSNCWTILFEVPKSRHEVNVEPPAASTARISSRDLFCKMLPLRFAHFMIFISQGVEFIFQQFIWTLLLSNASWHL